jgi:WD40 repeat protein
LALDSYEAILKGGKTPVVKKGMGDDSMLVTLLRYPKPSRRMPLDAEPLDDATVALLKKWVDLGMPEGVKPKEDEAAIVTTPGRSRKLDVVLATKTPLPKLVAKPGQTGPLELVLPVGPLAPITALAFSPNGKQLAAGCYGRVTVWDMATGSPLKVLTNVLGAVNDIRFSADGKSFAVAGGQPSARGDIRLYDTADWRLTATLGGHLDVVSSIAFRHDGKQLASASFDKTVRIWDLETKQPVLTYTGHSDFVYGVAFGPQGDWFVTASKDRSSRMIDAKTGKSIFTFSGTELDVLTVAVRPDGEQVVTSGFEAALSWWNTKTGERIRRQGGHDIATNEIAFPASGEIAVSAGGDRTVRVWDAKTGVQAKSLPVGSMVYSVAVRNDGKVIASGSFDGLVRIWDHANTRLLTTLLATPDGDWLALTPEVFCNGSEGIVTTGRWRTSTSGQVLPAEQIWKPAKQPVEVAKALKLEKLGEPAFAVAPK